MGDVAEQRERMTLERARTIATLDIDDIADLLAVPVKTAYKLSQRNAIPGRIKELGRSLRFRSAAVIAWLTREDASGRNR